MKYYIIRLKNNEISEKHANECVEQAKQFGINVEFFDAVNGLVYQEHLNKLGIKPVDISGEYEKTSASEKFNLFG